MIWNYPYGTNRTTTAGAQQPPHSMQGSGRPVNELVLNRQQNTAGLWNGGIVTLKAAPLVDPTAQWVSPIFDLRPDLPFLSQGDVEATPVYRSRTGDWGSLWVLIEGLNQNFGGGLGFAGLQVRYQELASPLNPTLVRKVTNPVDITGQFAVGGSVAEGTQREATLLQFKPTGDVDPVRYWQIKILFNWAFTFTSTVQLRVQSSYY